jgi:misacylated tRNA(Ala) deacylase
MTELLYHRDAYRTSFDAEVVAVSDDGAALLDSTAFYPGGGGQPHDVGSLSTADWQAQVVRVAPGPDGVRHWLDGSPPPVGTAVLGTIDWDRRYALMRTHTALHILCGLIWRDLRRLSTGCDMKPLTAHIDFELDEVGPETLTRLQAGMDQEIAAARPIEVAILPRREAEAIPDLLRTKVNLLPANLTHIRTVAIVGLDLQADGGTHVANTAEVGAVRIVRYKSKGRQNKRLYLELPPRDAPR